MALIRRINHGVKVKAGALYFVIFLLFLMTILLTTFILFIHYKNQLLIRQIGTSQIEQNIESAIELYSVKPEIVDKSNTATVSLFQDTPSKVVIKRDSWGVYQIISFSAAYKQIKRCKQSLFGYRYGSIPPTALYMTDKDRYLSICGNSRVVGNCYLPILGMRTARIEGKLFDGIVENREGYIHQSRKEMPAPPEAFLADCKAILMGEVKGIVKSYESILGKKSVFNSFADSLMIFTSPEKYWWVENVIITGKVHLYSNNVIYITPSTKLQNVIVAGRKIVVKKGFEGTVQLFATDTIILEENVRLLYPSSISVIDSKPNQKLVIINKNCEVQGCGLGLESQH